MNFDYSSIIFGKKFRKQIFLASSNKVYFLSFLRTISEKCVAEEAFPYKNVFQLILFSLKCGINIVDEFRLKTFSAEWEW